MLLPLLLLVVDTFIAIRMLEALSSRSSKGIRRVLEGRVGVEWLMAGLLKMVFVVVFLLLLSKWIAMAGLPKPMIRRIVALSPEDEFPHTQTFTRLTISLSIFTISQEWKGTVTRSQCLFIFLQNMIFTWTWISFLLLC
jgi:hypothetical protein